MIWASKDYENKIIEIKRLLCRIQFHNDALILHHKSSALCVSEQPGGAVRDMQAEQSSNVQWWKLTYFDIYRPLCFRFSQTLDSIVLDMRTLPSV